MNSLSWLIYFAGVAGSLGTFLGFLSFVCIASVGLICFTWAISEGECDGRRYFKFLIPSFVLFGLISAAIPSKETVYAIAASEVGEEIVKSKTANKALDALNAWLDKQIATLETTKETKPQE